MISNFFDSLPDRWGLRGVPFLWDDMKVKLHDTPVPENKAELELILMNTFIELIGETPERGKNYYVLKYNRGGMSGGYVCSDWWIDIAFPLIMNRYTKWTINSVVNSFQIITLQW